MSMIVVKDWVMASDTQMLVACGTSAEYREIEKKIHLDIENQFVLGIVGSSVDRVCLALIQNMLRVRLTAFYLGYDACNPLEFTDEETMLLTGYATDNNRLIYLATAEHVWFIKWIKDEEQLEIRLEQPGEFFCMGSELRFANIYHKAGLSAPEIIERISVLSPTCGGESTVINLKKLAKFPRTTAKKSTRRSTK
ncbi:hypothetical protein D3C71_365090 [compost metagenome]